MLQKIVEYLKSTSKPIDSDELARALGVERSALDGMLETLLRQKRIAIEEDLCCDCPLNKSGCNEHTPCAFAGKTYKRYTLPQKSFILPHR